MEMTFRWYGESDPVTLDKIRQIPVISGVVSAVYDVPAGQVWPRESVGRIKEAAERRGLSFKVVESVPVHEDIKLGRGGRGEYIDNYCRNIEILGEAGVQVICYNFMPVFDWFRSDLASALPDGSNALAYDDGAVLAMNPAEGGLSLPGWDESYERAELKQLLEDYKSVDEEKLWANLEIFLKKIIPVCEKNGVKMAIHPDDPPWGIFGLPRIITGIGSYERLAAIAPSPANGITLCTGSLGAEPRNDILEIINKFADRIHFVHARNILYTGERRFTEAAHPGPISGRTPPGTAARGSLDMVKILRALRENGFDGFIRPDHGRMIWGESGRPGYGLFDRALGAMYLAGIWESMADF